MTFHRTGPPETEAPPPTADERRPTVLWSLLDRDARIAQGLRLATLEFELAECRRHLRGAKAAALGLAILLSLVLMALVLVA